VSDFPVDVSVGHVFVECLFKASGAASDRVEEEDEEEQKGNAQMFTRRSVRDVENSIIHISCDA